MRFLESESWSEQREQNATPWRCHLRRQERKPEKGENWREKVANEEGWGVWIEMVRKSEKRKPEDVPETGKRAARGVVLEVKRREGEVWLMG